MRIQLQDRRARETDLQCPPRQEQGGGGAFAFPSQHSHRDMRYRTPRMNCSTASSSCRNTSTPRDLPTACFRAPPPSRRLRLSCRPQRQPRPARPAAAAGGNAYQLVAQLAAALDEAPEWTLDQIAGLAFGTLLLAFYFSSWQVDAFVARAQRRQLGLCQQCGGLYEASTCSQAGCPQRASSTATTDSTD